MKIYHLIIMILFSLHTTGQPKTLYDFTATTIDGKEFDFSTLKGKKVMIVNTASKCALTPQFKKLKELYEEYGGDDFEIIGFPCNDFANEDPASNSEIHEFCTSNYGVTFRMMSKISIKGENKHPIYKWLTSKEENGKLDAKVMWNFQKFLINRSGQVEKSILPIVSPKNKKIIKWIKN